MIRQRERVRSAKIAEVIRTGQGSARAQGALVPFVMPTTALLRARVLLDVPQNPIQRLRLDGPRDSSTTPARPAPASAVDASPVVWTATGLEPQVFLDHTGRRGRRVSLAGAGMAMLSAGWLAALVTGAIGFSSLPSLQVPVAGHPAARHPARIVHVAARRSRRHLVETAAVATASAAAAHELARSEISSPPGTIR